MDVDPDEEDDEEEEEADEEEGEGTATGTRLTGAPGSRGPFDYRFLGGGSAGESDPRSSYTIRLPTSHPDPPSIIFASTFLQHKPKPKPNPNPALNPPETPSQTPSANPPKFRKTAPSSSLTHSSERYSPAGCYLKKLSPA